MSTIITDTNTQTSRDCLVIPMNLIKNTLGIAGEDFASVEFDKKKNALILNKSKG